MRSTLTRLALAVAVGIVWTSWAAADSDPLREGRELFLQNQLDRALPVLERAVTAQPRNPDAHAWLAETCRRRGDLDRAEAEARAALDLDPCHAFARCVLGDAFNPQYGSWSRVSRDSSDHHILLAADCDPRDGNAWLGVWQVGLRRDDPDRVARALHELARTRFFTRAVLAHSRWLLSGLPQDAILITNGDMDTYPLHMLQLVEGLRPDVRVVNQPLLNLDWYRRLVRDRYDIRLALEPAAMDSLDVTRDADGTLVLASDRMIAGWFDMLRDGRLDRPLCLSVTVASSPISEEHQVLRGGHWRVVAERSESPIDLPAVESSLRALRPEEFRGPYVSAMDRSPIRRVYTGSLAENPLAAAKKCIAECRADGRPAQAEGMRRWARDYARRARLGAEALEQLE